MKYRRAMNRATLMWSIASILAGQAACGSSGSTAVPGSDANDAADARCATQAIALGTHPHAIAQSTPLGRTLADTRGWHGRLYFAYGDLEANTGPIFISSYEPKTRTWTDHLLGTQ